MAFERWERLIKQVRELYKDQEGTGKSCKDDGRTIPELSTNGKMETDSTSTNEDR